MADIPSPARTSSARLPDGATAATDASRPAFPPFDWRRGLLLPCMTLVAIAVILTGELDMKIASWLYSAGGNEWIYRNGFWTESVIHKAGRLVTYAGVLFLITLVSLGYFVPGVRPRRRSLIWLLIAVVLSTGIVSIVKRYSGLDCPWSISGLGGTRPYITLFDLRPMASGCFPSGHASGGYAWLALYFFCLEAYPRLRWAGFAAGLGLGLIFGVGQQLRGAHFLSHDVVTVLICWTVPALLYMARKSPVPPPPGSILARSAAR